MENGKIAEEIGNKRYKKLFTDLQFSKLQRRDRSGQLSKLQRRDRSYSKVNRTEKRNNPGIDYDIIKNKLLSVNKLLFMTLLIILLLPSVFSLGITPGRTTMDYEQGLESEMGFSVLNNEHNNMQVLFTVQGELSESITLFENMVEFLPSEESKHFTYRVTLPDEIGLEPGLHEAEIVAMEIPKASAEGTYVGATVAVVSQLHVYVPCPGKCVETSLSILDMEQGGTATFIVPVKNQGKLGIGEVRAVIDIYSSLNEKITTIETDYTSLESGKRTELSSKWNVDALPGDYLAKVTVLYDGESRSFEKEFAIGEKKLSIESILVNNFQLGEIAKLQILVENRWSQEIKDVFANLLVYNFESQVMADVKSSSEDIPALDKKELLAYWDTIGVEEGEYDGKLMVHYGEKSSDKNLILKISEDNLDITGVGYAIRPSGGKGIDLTTILLVLVIILLVVNLAWFVFFKRFMKNRKSKVVKA